MTVQILTRLKRLLRRCTLPLLAIGALLAPLVPASAQSQAVDLQAAQADVDIGRVWEALRLPRGSSADDARRAPQHAWLPLAQEIVSLAQGEALWLRFRLAPYGSLLAPRRLLEIARPGLDGVELFRFEGDDLVLQEIAGDALSTAGWPVRARYPVFAVSPDGWQEVTYLLRVTHRGPVSLGARLVSEDASARIQRMEHLFFGAFFGAIGLLVVLAGGSLVTTRRTAYAWFMAYALVSGLCFFAASGQLGEWWFEAPAGWIHAAPYVLAVASAAFGVLYFPAALAFRQFSRAGTLFAWGVGMSGLLLAVAAPNTDWPLDRISAGYCVGALACAVWLLVQARRKGEGWSRLHLVSLVPYALALLWPMAETLSFAPVPEHAFAVIATACLVHLAATYFSLNAKVKTLREATMRLQASATVDPLTGTANFRRLRLRVPGLLARARHYRHQGAVLVVEIMNLQEFRGVGGRRAEEMALVRAADVVRSCIKNIDMVSRVDDAHFAVAVEGPVSESQASALASHMIAKGLRTFSLPPDHTPLQFRVCIQMVPRLTENLDEIIAAAQMKLKAVPPADPRRIFLEPADIQASPVPLRGSRPRGAARTVQRQVPEEV